MKCLRGKSGNWMCGKMRKKRPKSREGVFFQVRQTRLVTQNGDSLIKPLQSRRRKAFGKLQTVTHLKVGGKCSRREWQVCNSRNEGHIISKTARPYNLNIMQGEFLCSLPFGEVPQRPREKPSFRCSILSNNINIGK